MTVEIDHLAPGPWHPLTISAEGNLRVNLDHPAGCPLRCRLGRIIHDLGADLPPGGYRVRVSGLGVEYRHADGTAVAGHPVRLDPVVLSVEDAGRYAGIANEALNAYHHADLCGCDTWPDVCQTAAYEPGEWDTGAWYAALPALLAAFLHDGLRPRPQYFHLAEYLGVEPTLWSTEEAARAECDRHARRAAGRDATGREWEWRPGVDDGQAVQVWTRTGTATSGTVTTLTLQNTPIPGAAT